MNYTDLKLDLSKISEVIEPTKVYAEVQDNPLKGIIFMVLSTVFMVIANTLSKE